MAKTNVGYRAVKNYPFLLMYNIICKVSSLVVFLKLLCIWPPLLNNRSAPAEVADTAKYCRTILDNFGHIVLCFFHQACKSNAMPSNTCGSKRYWSTSLASAVSIYYSSSSSSSLSLMSASLASFAFFEGGGVFYKTLRIRHYRFWCKNSQVVGL